jgi:hypothetical protein
VRHRTLIIFAAAAATAAAVAAGVAFACESVPAKKVAVCKYVGKPGVNEVLKPGENPIVVSINALVGPAGGEPALGQEFSDAQGRSVVVALPGMAIPEQGSCTAPTAPESGAPAQPAITPATCTSGAVLTMPPDTDAIAYTAAGSLTGPSVVVVTATAREGYVLAAAEGWHMAEGAQQATLTVELAGHLTGCGGGDDGNDGGGGTGGVKGDTTGPPPVTGSPEPQTAFTL